MKVNVRATRRTALALVMCCSTAMARDLGPDEALNLRKQGVILPLEQLLQQAMARYPGSRLLEAELERGTPGGKASGLPAGIWGDTHPQRRASDKPHKGSGKGGGKVKGKSKGKKKKARKA